ncbi:hypothetical protein K490DRAFT_63798 [Saccharata proteae CBS 121410]|uniref:RING-type E3 ubiquitin transferase n=1 Tax=Saccharata proteae CBS 121410 TaxID=1314787 RepID=A0A6A5YCP4_9PEZI|nr:hypothetical protein K490DRAFT_63798 [Saccharata proteae CBS 121410]
MSEQQGGRDMVFCHECENEWYRDEHGLTCPDPACESEFTEIIEPDHDPRDDHAEDTMPNPLADFNPWNAPDPDEEFPEDEPRPGLGQGFRVQRNGPGQYAITATFQHTFGGQPQHNAGQGPGMDPLFENFRSMITNIRGQNEGAQQGNSEQGQQPGHEHYTQRRTYTMGPGGLHPRDANSPGPQSPPLDDLHHVITGLLGGGAGFFAAPGPMGQHTHDHAHPHDPNQARNPIEALLATFLAPSMAAHGDAVYSQEALDRVISQLMEQNASGNAPGPASADAIAALPKRKVTRDMLVDDTDPDKDKPDEELSGECSICMDAVKLGEEVTELPCHHWFHGACIEAWLNEHDTCPHCRKGIMPKTEDGNNSSNNSNSGSGPSSSSSNNNAGQPPGSGGPSSLGNSPPRGQDEGNQGFDGGGSFPRMPGGFYTSYHFHAPANMHAPPPVTNWLGPFAIPAGPARQPSSPPQPANRPSRMPGRRSSTGTTTTAGSHNSWTTATSNQNNNNDEAARPSNPAGPGLGERLRRTLFGR